ncbi:RNA polymerase sigma factor [Cnuella takakiae]|uniref:RNA polymerase sigma factor n=1 Tax=Cnuella takakiae TaxID=1302690 RepID=UPI000933AA59|nr:sigma-70 family RNA polymerase sigma factor [Cnuella takakiae]OLY93503.1 hypothetical protein BUE76_17660 [Cnuella takakiae]
MTQQEEHIIISKVLAGNSEAFASLVYACQDLAVITAYNILLNREDAEEIAQDAFVQAYQSLASFKKESRFSSWLYRIVVNKALNKKSIKRHYTIAITETDGGTVAGDLAGDFVFPQGAENRKYIQAALQQLQFNERLCLTLHYLNEFSIPEINQLTNLSQANIKVLLHRGRKNLYGILKSLLKDELTQLKQP